MKNIIRKAISGIVFVSAIVLSSCSQQTCSAYAKSEDKVYSMKMSRNRSNIPSPYNCNYKAGLQKKYTGRN